jgi:hypothetical protein
MTHTIQEPHTLRFMNNSSSICTNFHLINTEKHKGVHAFQNEKIKPHFEVRKFFFGCVPCHLIASLIINNNNTARLHLLPMCSRKSHTSLNIQYTSRAWHPKASDILCLAAVRGIPYSRGSCTFIHSPRTSKSRSSMSN